MKPYPTDRRLSVSLTMVAAVLAGAASGLLGVCGPFTDVSDAAFCPFVLEVFTLGITTGTSPTTYDPTSAVSRLQMAAFLSRTVDGVLKRGSRRAALNRFWTVRDASAVTLKTLSVTAAPTMIQSDGADVWATNNSENTVHRLRGSDGKLLETWTGASSAYGVLSAAGRVFVTGQTGTGTLYSINPEAAAGAVTAVATNLGGLPLQLAFDGSKIWTSNFGGGSVSIVDAFSTGAATTVTTGFMNPYGMVYDGANIWISDIPARTLLKLDATAAILQTVTVGFSPRFLMFDGTNVWVPNFLSNSVSVVRASTGAIVSTLTGNGLSGPVAAAFDGERALVTNFTGGSVSLWKAADLTTLGSLALAPGSGPNGVASDGVSFWIALFGGQSIARF